MEYKPKPIDTSQAKLSKEIIELTEVLAKNAHDNWAVGRLAEGWSYGTEKDPALKKNPLLIPFEDLPDSEKDYDRIAAMGTLKAILTLGYRIELPATGLSSYQHSTCLEENAVIKLLKDPVPLRLTELLRLWRGRSIEGRSTSLEFYQRLGERLIKLGEPLLAYDILMEGCNEGNWPDDVRLKQLISLALTRSGATGRANAILTELKGKGHRDGETMGILARTYKDLWASTSDFHKAMSYLLQAHEHYAEAFDQALRNDILDDGIYNGINAASTALLLNLNEKARSMAHKVQGLCLKRLNHSNRDYWALASLGESSLIMGDFKAADKWYSEACKIGRGHHADLSTTRRQARMLLKHLNSSMHLLDHCFAIPKVIVFAGHMIDQPGRLSSRFPSSLEKAVYSEIAQALQRLDAGIGYSSAACGSDILFLEAMIERKAEINVILPYDKDAFKIRSVQSVPGSAWGERFDRVLASTDRVLVASEHRYHGNSVNYHYANLLQDGLALLHGKILDTEVIPLVIWDGQSGDRDGGTASLVDHWRTQGREPIILDITKLLEETGIKIPNNIIKDGQVSKQEEIKDNILVSFPQEIRAILFFDVVGYSKLNEEQVPAFITYFMGIVDDLIVAGCGKPLFKNTWGDALYCVFSTIKDAGNFALELRNRVHLTEWEEKGLPKDLNLRISLHAGPLYSFYDPVLKIQSYSGTHVSLGARIEPTTPPGEVYASQQFAALALSQGVADFVYEYVGQVPLPKKSGIIPLYLVRRKQSQ